jgi:hypothetical protein
VALSIVQQKQGVNNSAGASVVMASAPTNGNLLVAVVSFYQGASGPVADTGWTEVVNDKTGVSGTNNGVWFGYKYAGAGESTTQTPVTGGSVGVNCVTQIWEIDGVAGTWASDYREEWHAVFLDDDGSHVLTTSSHNTIAGAQFVLTLISGTLDWTSGSDQTTPTLAANGQTDDSAGFNNSTSGSSLEKQAAASCHRFVATSGTAIQDACTFGVDQQKCNYLYVSLNSNTDVTVTPAAATLTVTGYAPTLSIAYTTAPAAGALVLTGHAPNAAVFTIVSPGAGSLVLTGYAPAANVELVSKIVGYASMGAVADTLVATKIVGYDATGAPADQAVTSKAVAYAVIGPPPPRRQTHVRMQILR